MLQSEHNRRLQSMSIGDSFDFRRARTSDRDGLTLLELAITLTLVAILLAILLPAVQQAREKARKLTCQNRLRQFGVAMYAYEATNRMFPPGNRGKRAGSLFVSMLPYLDQTPLYEKLEAAEEEYPTNPRVLEEAMQAPVGLFQCPSEKAPEVAYYATTSYAGNYASVPFKSGMDGMFRPISFHGQDGVGPIRPSDVTDGLSVTAAISELKHIADVVHRSRGLWVVPYSVETSLDLERMISDCLSLPPQPEQYGWVNGGLVGSSWVMGSWGDSLYNHTIPPGGSSCGDNGNPMNFGITASSNHFGGVNMLYGDGHVAFVADHIDLDAWRELGSRSAQLQPVE